MRATIQRAFNTCQHTANFLRHWELRSPVGYLAAVAAAAAVTILMVLAPSVPVPFLYLLAPLSLLLILPAANLTKPTTVSFFRHIRLHPVYFGLLLTVLLSTSISVVSVFHAQHIDANVIAPDEGLPWREGLAARVWWQQPPSEEMEAGFAETAQQLGFTYEAVQTSREANFRIQFDSWAYHCKLLKAYAFVSLNPDPSTLGSDTADIYICRFTTPLTGRRPSGDSLMAHETAHILAAQPHFGGGLMAEGGGNGAERFADTELEKMRDKIRVFRASAEPN